MDVGCIRRVTHLLVALDSAASSGWKPDANACRLLNSTNGSARGPGPSSNILSILSFSGRAQSKSPMRGLKLGKVSPIPLKLSATAVRCYWGHDPSRDNGHANRLSSFGKRPIAMQRRPVFGKSILLGASVCSLLSGCAVTSPAGTHLLTASGPANSGPAHSCPMDGGGVNGNSAENDWIGGGPASSAPVASQWEDPCSPEWPAACMPSAFSPPPTPLLDCLARLPHRQGLPEAPPYPRFHPLPTRPMFSPLQPAPLPPELAPAPGFGTDEPSVSVTSP